MKNEEIIAQLIKQGAKEVKNVTIKNVTVTPMNEYVRLGLTLDKEVDDYKIQDDGTYAPSKVKIIFVSAFTIATLLREDDNAAFAVNHLLKHPDALGMVLSRATINVIQQPVKEGEEYKNPFNDNADSKTFDHDTIINHIANIKLSDFGMKRLDKLADMMLGF